MNTVLNYATDFAQTGVDIGGKLITFMTQPGHEIALIGVVGFIVVLCTGLIARFFKN